MMLCVGDAFRGMVVLNMAVWGRLAVVFGIRERHDERFAHG
jgi:hypothetical protein